MKLINIKEMFVHEGEPSIDEIRHLKDFTKKKMSAFIVDLTEIECSETVKRLPIMTSGCPLNERHLTIEMSVHIMSHSDYTELTRSLSILEDALPHLKKLPNFYKIKSLIYE